MQKMDEMAAFKRMATRKIDEQAAKEDEKRYLEAIVAKQKEENDRKIAENEAIKKQKQEEEAALAAQAAAVATASAVTVAAVVAQDEGNQDPTPEQKDVQLPRDSESDNYENDDQPESEDKS